MKKVWVILSVGIVGVSITVGCRNSPKAPCSQCGATAPLPTNTFAPPNQAPVFNNQYIQPTQSFDPTGAVPLETAPMGLPPGVMSGSGTR